MRHVLPRTTLVLCLNVTMLRFRHFAVLVIVTVAYGQDYEFSSNPRPAPPRVEAGYSGPAAGVAKPTPVPILKQINRHNEDGSYTYGYEGADGSFKIETKLPTGEVKGKYGYVDDGGKVRVVEYGATKYGFEPSGEGITVAPPTLVDETTGKDGLNIQGYEEEPRARAQAPVQYKPAPAPVQYRPAPAPIQFSAPSPAPQRIHVPGANPSASFEFGSGLSSIGLQRSQPSLSDFSNPAPIEEETYEQPAPRPRITYAQPRPQPSFKFAPAITRPQVQFQPAPQPQYQPAPEPHYAPRPAPQPSGRAGGVLDQLAKDYALPANAGAPLHDISFGYY